MTIQRKRMLCSASGAAMGLLMGLLAAGSAAAQSCLEPRTKIVGGEQAILKNWPGQAALRRTTKQEGQRFYFCGGTAIAPEWVLTAAHCLPKSLTDAVASGDSSFEVVLGAADLKKVTPANVYEVAEWRIKDGYSNAVSGGEDIALLRLKRPYKGPFMALSSSSSTDPGEGDLVRVAGFGGQHYVPSGMATQWFEGAVEAGWRAAGSERLLEATMQLIPEDVCVERNSVVTGTKLIGPKQICAGPDVGPSAGSCQGDSGGPLVAYTPEGCPIQVGLVSWAAGCGQEKYPAVYTRVSQYYDWIESEMGAKPLTAASLQSGNTLSAAERIALERQLKANLGPAEANLEIQISGGKTSFAIGEEVVFAVKSKVHGALYLIDIDAAGAVAPIFPNSYVTNEVAKVIPKDQWITIPNREEYRGLRFEAVPPPGDSMLIAVVSPNTIQFEQPATKGIAPKEALETADVALAPLQGLLGAIEAEILKSGEPDKWGMAIVKYRVTN